MTAAHWAPPGIRAGIAPRLPGERIAKPSEVTAAYAAALRRLSADPARTVVARQVHGARVETVDAETARSGLERGLVVHPGLTCDGLITAAPGVALGVVTADCLPVLLADVKGRAVAAVHAGWRGLAAGILKNAVARLLEGFQIPATDLRAYIGPAICKDCFETGPEVAAAMARLLGPAALDLCSPGSGDRVHPDLKRLGRLSLAQAGLRERDVCFSPDCTCCQNGIYWSHRRHGSARGNQLNVIVLETEGLNGCDAHA